ncbi:MAG: alpha/beta hydrolase [Acidobacteriota bacterium]
MLRFLRPALLIGLFFNLDAESQAEQIEVAPQVNLYYEVQGEGEPLLFLPGWTLTSGIWREQVTVFSKSRQVWVLDPRSHGNSSKVLSGNSLAQQARDLDRFFLLNGLNQVTVVASSSAVATMLEYVRQFGNQRLRGLVFVDGSPCLLRKDDWPVGLSLDQTYEFLMNVENDRVRTTDLFIQDLFLSERSGTELDWFLKESLRTPTTIATVLAYDYHMLDRRPLLSKIAIPTLIVAAESNRQTGELMQAQIPNAKLTVLEKLGRAPFLEDPTVFNELLEKFLTALP